MQHLVATPEELRELVETQHCGRASPLYGVRVRHVTGDLLWEATVQVFGLDRNPNAVEAYAWTCPFDGKTHAMLKSNRISGPADAVRATLQASGWGPNFHEHRPHANRSTAR